ncbi:MAG: hypothetical protein FD129_474 [bacterium]|nr:MAG: hypothetical protein FD129_474 [bacterium]
METAIAQLRFLSSSLDGGGATGMQAVFPEGFVFTWALYGLAEAEVARALPRSDARRSVALARARIAVERVLSDDARKPFALEMQPPCGAFYASWSLYLRSVVLRATDTGDPAPFDLVQYEQDCDAFAAVLAGSESPFLPSYPDAVWPADTVMGVAALAIHGQVLDSRYDLLIARWLEDVDERLDPELGAISHVADAIDGMPRGGARGGSLALMSRTLVDVDSALARRQYEILRRHFVDYAWGIPGVREYPHGVDGPGDIDSGPLVFGFAGPATVVGLGAAIAHGDEELASSLLATPDMTGFPIELAGQRRYAGGLVPVGDAFLAWARTTPAGPRTTAYPPIMPAWWRLPFHAVSAVASALMLVMSFGVGRRRRSGRPSTRPARRAA